MLKNPIRDVQDDPPACFCQNPKCRGEVWPGQTRYYLYGRMYCEECFKDEITRRLESDPRGLALELGVEMERVS